MAFKILPREEKPPKTQAERDAYLEGYIDGLVMFAHWRDGVEYVGTCGRTLESAIEDAKNYHAQGRDKF